MGRRSVYIRKPVINIGDVNHSLMGRTRQLHGRRRKPNILEEGIHPTAHRGGVFCRDYDKIILIIIILKTTGKPLCLVAFSFLPVCKKQIYVQI